MLQSSDEHLQRPLRLKLAIGTGRKETSGHTLYILDPDCHAIKLIGSRHLFALGRIPDNRQWRLAYQKSVNLRDG
jgi:hypothetical protein